MKPAAPLIGITSDLAGAEWGGTAEPLYFLAQRYVKAIVNAGAIALILPPAPSSIALRRLLARLDGLVLSGGNFDIHPSYYGEKPLAGLGTIKAERSNFELDLTAAALKQDLPLLGICGGAQAINVALGGSLYQDIGAQVGDAQEHQQSRKSVKRGHRISIQPRTLLRKIVGRSHAEVNTTHHQAVKTLGRGLIVNAVAGDGIIEGIESTRHAFVIGVQWHPEVLAPRQRHQRRIFVALVACAARRL
ncbi:MAG: gamma-glutamyl-gamma-aminobutyrate hydrolase family protein [Candidatus Binatia bacterium]